MTELLPLKAYLLTITKAAHEVRIQNTQECSHIHSPFNCDYFQRKYIRNVVHLIGVTALLLNLIALTKTKISYNFGLSECSKINRLK